MESSASYSPRRSSPVLPCRCRREWANWWVSHGWNILYISWQQQMHKAAVCGRISWILLPMDWPWFPACPTAPEFAFFATEVDKSHGWEIRRFKDYFLMPEILRHLCLWCFLDLFGTRNMLGFEIAYIYILYIYIYMVPSSVSPPPPMGWVPR